MIAVTMNQRHELLDTNSVLFITYRSHFVCLSACLAWTKQKLTSVCQASCWF